MTSAPLPPATFDHAVYAGPDLAALIDEIEASTHIRPVFGGEHDGLGTHNALLGLGDRRYLELLAPIPVDAPPTGFARLLAGLEQPRVFMWAVRVPDVSRFVETGTNAGLAMGRVAEMSRTRPDAPAQHWKLSTGGADVYGSVLPFGIQWTTAAHPSDDLTPGCTLASLRAQHPEPERIRSALETIGGALSVDVAPEPGLILELDSPAGRVELR